jgi:hypothetical protein
MFEVKLILIYVVVALTVALLVSIHAGQRSYQSMIANFIVGMAGGWAAAALLGKLGPAVYGLPLVWVVFGSVIAVAAEIAIVSHYSMADSKPLPGLILRRTRQRPETAKPAETPISSKKAA